MIKLWQVHHYRINLTWKAEMDEALAACFSLQVVHSLSFTLVELECDAISDTFTYS